jgi:hypothetical protein
MKPNEKAQAVEMLLSWTRVFAAASLAVWLSTGAFDFQSMTNAGFAAVLPVIIRWLDPADKAYGRGANG